MKTDLFQVYFDAEGKDGGDGDNSTPKTEVKTFTQEEVNSIVTARLAKEKDKYKDYDEIKTKVGELNQVQEKLTKLEAEKTTFDTTLQGVYDGLIQGIDESKKSLIPEQLSLADKIKYINTNRSTLLSAPINNASTPPKEEGSKGEAGLYGGKYKTMIEYANADPKGYLEARKAGKI